MLCSVNPTNNTINPIDTTPHEALYENILIIDSRPVRRKKLAETLQKKNINPDLYRFHFASSLEKGLEFIRNPDLTLAVIIIRDEEKKTDLLFNFIGNVRITEQNTTVRIIVISGSDKKSKIQKLEEFDISGIIKEKELLGEKLPMLLSIELRAFKQIRTIVEHNRSLTEMVSLASSFLNLRSENEIIRIAMKKIEKFLATEVNGAIVVDLRDSEDSIELFPGCGRFTSAERLFPTHPLFSVVSNLIETSIKSASPFFDEKHVLIPTDNTEEHIRFLFLEAQYLFSPQDLQMLRLFTALVETANNNVSLWERLRVSAHYDSLTGILNRSGFIAAIKKKMITNIPHDIGILDVDGFSVVNNAMGYDLGDRILSAITDRLKSIDRNNLILARIAGDTFGLLAPSDTFSPGAIMKIFDRPFILDDTPFPLKGSLGLSHITPECKDPLKIYNEAQIAMKKAKMSSRLKFLYFHESMNSAVREQIKIIKELRSAIENKNLFLFFHPQFDLKTNRLVGAESLLRWQKENGEMIPPASFIPIAESSGLIVEIGEFVVEESFRQMAKWEEEGLVGFSLAINVSPRQLYDETFISFLSENLEKYKVPAERIKIEVTESMMIRNMERVIDILIQIRNLGMQISIDDFGTGFSSLSYLQRLPVHELKIDGSFVSNITSDERSRTISKMIVTLGKSLDLSVLAEGIENEEEVEFLKEIGCDEGQGFLYAEPLSTEDFSEFYKVQKTISDKINGK